MSGVTLCYHMNDIIISFVTHYNLVKLTHLFLECSSSSSSPKSSSASSSSVHVAAAPPGAPSLHPSSPFTLCKISGNISVCAGCRNKYPKHPNPPDDLCIKHQEWHEYIPSTMQLPSIPCISCCPSTLFTKFITCETVVITDPVYSLCTWSETVVITDLIMYMDILRVTSPHLAYAVKSHNI